MSIEVMSLVLNHSKAKGRAKLILMGIANHQGEQGAWPSLQTLAGYANASRSSVQRDIEKLVAMGELKVELQAAPVNSKYKANLYWVTILGVSNSVPGVSDLHSGVSDLMVRGVKNDLSGVSVGDSLNIIKKPKENLIRKAFSNEWNPTQEQRDSLQEKYPNANLDKELENMIDYILATGKEKDVKDMAARFRTWMSNADKYAKGALSKKIFSEYQEWK